MSHRPPHPDARPRPGRPRRAEVVELPAVADDAQQPDVGRTTFRELGLGAKIAVVPMGLILFAVVGLVGAAAVVAAFRLLMAAVHWHP